MMSYKSYAYDPQGNKHETYVKDGKTYTSSGDRLGAGWTSQTAGGIYKMGSDGVGQKVSSHNTVSNNNYSSNSGSSSGSNYSSSGGSKNSYNDYSQPVTNDGRVYGTVNGRDWDTGEQAVDYRYRDGRSNPDNSGYGWKDPSTSEYLAVRLPNGTTTSLPKDKALEMSQSSGYEIIGASSGLGKWNTDDAIRNNTSGADWVDDGYNNGSVMLRDSSGRMSSVNAVYADKYFKQGYTLDAKSQSINRALQSNYHRAVNEANSAISDGTYNPNNNYARDFGYVEGKGYAFDGSTMNNYMIPQQQNIPQQQIPPQNVNQNNQSSVRHIGNGNTVEKTDSKKWRVNINGQSAELNEDDYIRYMSELLGL